MAKERYCECGRVTNPNGVCYSCDMGIKDEDIEKCPECDEPLDENDMCDNPDCISYLVDQDGNQWHSLEDETHDNPLSEWYDDLDEEDKLDFLDSYD